MMGAKQKERYNEIGLPIVGYSANCTLGRSCDIQNNSHIFHICALAVQPAGDFT